MLNCEVMRNITTFRNKYIWAEREREYSGCEDSERVRDAGFEVC